MQVLADVPNVGRRGHDLSTASDGRQEQPGGHRCRRIREHLRAPAGGAARGLKSRGNGAQRGREIGLRFSPSTAKPPRTHRSRATKAGALLPDAHQRRSGNQKLQRQMRPKRPVKRPTSHPVAENHKFNAVQTLNSTRTTRQINMLRFGQKLAKP